MSGPFGLIEFKSKTYIAPIEAYGRNAHEHLSGTERGQRALGDLGGVIDLAVDWVALAQDERACRCGQFGHARFGRGCG
jgi:hypothetical protein